MEKELWKYLHQRVVISAFGIEYTGIFKGADEDWVFLQCETTWVQIPWLEITSFKPAEAKEDARLYRTILGEPEPDAEAKKKKTKRTLETELKLIRGEKEAENQKSDEKETENSEEEKD